MLREGKTVECKREYVEDIKNTVVAFANADGGTIYIGVEDDGTICGVTDMDGIMLRASNAIRDAIRPDVTMFTECKNEIIEGKGVISITVQRGTARPYYLAGKGIRPEGVYVRQGSSTVPATESAILSMIKETSGEHYEDARSLNQQLTFEKTEAYFKSKNIELGNAQKRTLNLINADAMYTNLALLLSEQCTHTIKLATFEGSKKIVFKDRRELDGSLLEQLEEAYSYIDRYNRTRAEIQGLERVDMRDYPPEAVREALLNAVVHRDYSFSSSTLISLFDDRIEFVSIGGLLRGISLDDIKLGISVLRNPKLANIFYRLQLIEAYGTGMLKINSCYEEYPEKARIEVSDNAFKITLPNTNYRRENANGSFSTLQSANSVKAKDRRESDVIALLKKTDRVTREEVQKALNVSQATAINLLRAMSEKGILVKIGAGKQLCYQLQKN